jgi:hypothetical protein
LKSTPAGPQDFLGTPEGREGIGVLVVGVDQVGRAEGIELGRRILGPTLGKELCVVREGSGNIGEGVG